MLAREKLEQENTFLSVAQSWFEFEKENPKIKNDTLVDKWRSIELHLLPHIKSISIQEIKPKLIIPILNLVKGNGNLETARRLVSRINQIMDYAVVNGLIELNPCQNMIKALPACVEVNHPCISISDLPQFLIDFSYSNSGKITRLLFKWQLLTATRASEAALTQWNEIDEAAQLWTIPAERMKARREHTIPLSNQAMRIYAELKRIKTSNDYLFPSLASKGKHINTQTVNALIKRMGYGGKMVSHSFRSLASTVLNSYQGKNLERFDHDVIEAALAHQDKNQVRRAYNRADYLEQKKQVFQFWADFIDRAEQGNINLIEN